jgi:chromosome segregation ATPase
MTWVNLVGQAAAARARISEQEAGLESNRVDLERCKRECEAAWQRAEDAEAKLKAELIECEAKGEARIAALVAEHQRISEDGVDQRVSAAMERLRDAESSADQRVSAAMEKLRDAESSERAARQGMEEARQEVEQIRRGMEDARRESAEASKEKNSLLAVLDGVASER